jgi:hypothetical protein
MRMPQGWRIFPASGVRGALGGHVQDHSQHHQEACDDGRSQDGLRPHVSAQEVVFKVQVLNANLVAMCMPSCDAYHTRSVTRNAGASVHRAVEVRQCREFSLAC